MYLLYSVLLAVAFVLALPYYLWKDRRTGKYRRTLFDRLGRLPVEVSGRRAIWIHAVSVGEVLAARVLVPPLKARFPGRSVFVSTTTITGQEIARRTLGAADGIFFAPFDFAFAVRRVLNRIDPALVVLVETEIWPNLIHEAKRRGASVAMVNGRLSPRSFPRYRRVRSLLRRVLGEVDLFLMQSEPHALRARLIGAPAERVRVSGNLKFDALPDAARPRALAAVLNGASRGPLWVAGSTVAGEEPAVLAAFHVLRKTTPEARLIIAPRHPERFAEMAPLVASAGLTVTRRSALGERPWHEGDVLVLDTLGELAHVYAYATVVFVGGSLVPAGGHNILEPAVAGKAVVVGSHMENFQEIADAFIAAGALVQVARTEDLAPVVARLFTSAEERAALGDRARAMVDANRGACERTVEALAALVA